MPHLTFADLINRRVPLAAHEAAALTLAVARLMDAQRSAGQRVQLPDDDWILLSSSGEVSVVDVHANDDGDETERLSALLRRLLHLDDRHISPERGVVPGGLLIVLARNLGYIHLPATSPLAFRAALERFASAEPSVLAGVFWRAASGRPELMPRVVSTTSRSRRNGVERRRHGLTPSELRRSLRDVERELFELRSRLARTGAAAAPVNLRRGAVAATLAIGLTGALAVASLGLTAGSGDRDIADDIPASLASETDSMDVRTWSAVPVAAIGMQPVTVTSAVHTMAASPVITPSSVISPSSEGVAVGGGEPQAAFAAEGAKVVPVRVRNRPSPARTVRGDTPVRKRADPLAVHRGGTRGIPF